ncbi:MAG: cell division FtsA domain-containing protein, partial [Sarcina sp.]
KNVKVFTKNHFSFEKSSIITPISIVKEIHDRLKLIYDQQILWNKKVIIDDNSNKSKNVKKRGFSRVRAFLDEIF